MCECVCSRIVSKKLFWSFSLKEKHGFCFAYTDFTAYMQQNSGVTLFAIYVFERQAANQIANQFSVCKNRGEQKVNASSMHVNEHKITATTTIFENETKLAANGLKISILLKLNWTGRDQINGS